MLFPTTISAVNSGVFCHCAFVVFFSTDTNSAKSAHLSNKWMPELESTCDCGSKTLFLTRSFTLEHRFAFDSRVPASSCVQSVLSHCKVDSNRVTALLQPNKHVRHSVLDRKSPKDSISGIHMLPRCAEHVRFLSVGSKLQQISWEKSLVPRIAQNRLI